MLVLVCHQDCVPKSHHWDKLATEKVISLLCAKYFLCRLLFQYLLFYAESIPAISSNQSSELMEPNTGNMTNFHSSGSILQIKSTNKRTFNKSKGAPQKLPEMPLTYENIRETEYGAKNLTINPCGILDLIRKNMEGLHFNIPPENKESMQNDDLSEWSD